MRLLFTFYFFTFLLFSNSGKTTALGGSGSIDVSRVASTNYFEANLARDKKEPQLYLSFSIKSSHQNILSQTDKINIYNIQRKEISTNKANKKITTLGLASIQNALDAIESLNKNQDNNMIEYISPNFTLSYRFRNLGFGFSTKSYRYAYIRSITNLSYNKDAIYASKDLNYAALETVYDDYIKKALLLEERYITLDEVFMSYSNALPFSGNKLLYGLSINVISAEYFSESNNSKDRFNNNTIYENMRQGKAGESSSNRVSYDLSFIFIPSWTKAVTVGLAFNNFNTSTFGDFYYDSKIILSGNYTVSNFVKLHYERDLKGYKNIYKTRVNQRQSLGLEITLPDVSLLAGYEQNKNTFKSGIISFGFSYKNIDVGYRTRNNFSNYSNGELKDFGELTVSFRKET